MCFQSAIKNTINKLPCTDDYFRNYHHLRNFEVYCSGHNFFACCIHTSRFGPQSVLYYCNYRCNPLLNKRLRKADKNSHCEKRLFLSWNHPFLYCHCLFGHYLFHYQRNWRIAFHLINNKILT